MSENASTLAVLVLLCARLTVCSGQSSEPTSVSQIDNKSPAHGVPILDGGRSLLSETSEESSDSNSEQPYQSTPHQFQEFRSNQNEEMQKIPTFVVRSPMSRFDTLVPVGRSPLEINTNNSISFGNRSPNPMTWSRSSAQDNIAPNSQFLSSKELANKIPIYVITPPAPGEKLPSLINMAVFPKETINPDIFRILGSLRFPPGSVPLVLLAAPIPAVTLNVPNSADSSINALDFVPPEENRQPMMDAIPQNMVSDETWYDEDMIKRYRPLHGNNPSSHFPNQLRRIPQHPNPSELLSRRKLPYFIESPAPYWIHSGSGNLRHRPPKLEEIPEPNQQRTPSEDKTREIDVPIVYRNDHKYRPIQHNRMKYPITDREESIYAPITLETVPADEIRHQPQFPRSEYFPYPSSDDQVPLFDRPIFDPGQSTNQTQNGYPIDNYSEFPVSVEKVPSTKRQPEVISQINRFVVPRAPPKPSSPETYPYFPADAHAPDAQVLGYPIFNSDKPEFEPPQNYPLFPSEYTGDPVLHSDPQPQQIYPGSAPHLSPNRKLVPPQNYPRYPLQYKGDSVPQHDSQQQPIYPDSAPQYLGPQLQSLVGIGKLDIPNEPQIMPSYRYHNPDGRLSIQDYPGQQPNYHPYRQLPHPTHTRPNAPTRSNILDDLNTLSPPSTEQPEPLYHVNYPFVEMPTIKQPHVESNIGRFILPENQNTINYPQGTPVYRQDSSAHVLKPRQQRPQGNVQYFTLPSSDEPNNYGYDGPPKPLDEFLPEDQMNNKLSPTNDQMVLMKPRLEFPSEFNELTIPEDNDAMVPQTYRILPSSEVGELNNPNSDPHYTYPQYPHDGKIPSFPEQTSDGIWPRVDFILQSTRPWRPRQEYPHPSPIDTDKHYPYVSVGNPQHQYPRYPSGHQVESYPRIPTEYTKQRPDVISGKERFEIPAQPLLDLQPEYPEPNPTDIVQQYSFPRVLVVGQQPLDQYPRLPSNRHVQYNPTVPSDNIDSRPDIISSEGRFDIPLQPQYEPRPEYPHPSRTNPDKRYPYVKVQQPKNKHSRFPSDPQEELYPTVLTDYNKPRPDVISDGGRFEIPAKQKSVPKPEYPYNSPLDADEPYPYVRVEQPQDQHPLFPSGHQIESYPRIANDHAERRTDVNSNDERFEIPAQTQSKLQPKYPEPTPNDTDEQHSFPRVVDVEEHQPDQYPRLPSNRQIVSNPIDTSDHIAPRPDIISRGGRFEIPPQPQLELQPEYPEPTLIDTDEQYSFPQVVDDEEQKPDQYPRVTSGRQVETYPRIPTNNTKQRPDIISRGERFKIPAKPLLPEYPDPTITDKDEQHSLPLVVDVEEQQPDQYPRIPSNPQVVSRPTVTYDYIAPRPDTISSAGRFEIPPNSQYEPQPEYLPQSPTHADKRFPYVKVQQLQDKYPTFPSNGQVQRYESVPTDYTKRRPDVISSGERFEITPQPQLELQPEYLEPAPSDTGEQQSVPPVVDVEEQKPQEYPQLPSGLQVKRYPRIHTDYTKRRPDVFSKGERFEIPAQPLLDLQPEYPGPTETDTDEQYSFPRVVVAEEQLDQYPRLPSNHHLGSNPTVPSDHIVSRPDIISSGERFEISRQPQHEPRKEYHHLSPTHGDKWYPIVRVRQTQNQYQPFPSDGEVVRADNNKPIPEVISDGERFEVPAKLQSVHQPEYAPFSPLVTDELYPHTSGLQLQAQYPQFPSDRQVKSYPRVPTDNTLTRPDIISNSERFEIPSQPQTEPQPEYSEPTPTNTVDQYSFPRGIVAEDQQPDGYPLLPSNHHVKANFAVPSDNISPRPEIISSGGRLEITPQPQYDPQPKYPHPPRTDPDKRYPNVRFRQPQDKFPQFPLASQVESYSRVPSNYNKPRPNLISNVERFEIPAQLQLAPQPRYLHPSSSNTLEQYPHIRDQQPQVQYPQFPSQHENPGNPRIPADNTLPRPDVISRGERFEIPELTKSDPTSEYLNPSPSDTDHHYPYARYSPDFNEPKPDAVFVLPRPVQTPSEPQPEYFQPTLRDTDLQSSFSPDGFKRPQDQYPQFPSDHLVADYPRVPAYIDSLAEPSSKPLKEYSNPYTKFSDEKVSFPDTDHQYPRADELSHLPSDVQGLVHPEFPFDNTKPIPDVTSGVNRLIIPEQSHSEPLPEYPYYSPEGTDEQYRYPLVGVREPQNQYPQFPIDHRVIDHPKVPSTNTEPRPDFILVPSQSEPLQEYPAYFPPLSTDKWYRYPYARDKQPEDQYSRFPSDHQVSGYPTVPFDDSKPRPDVASNAQIIYIPSKSHPHPPQPSLPHSNEHYYYPDSPIQPPDNVQYPSKDDQTQGYPASKLPVDGTQPRSDSTNLPQQPYIYPHITPKDTIEPYYNIDNGGHLEQPLLKEHPQMPSDGKVTDHPVPYPTEHRPVPVISNVPIVQVQSNPEFQQEYAIPMTPSEMEEVYNYPGNKLHHPPGDEYPSFDRPPRPNVDFNAQRVYMPQQPLSEPLEKFPVYDNDNDNEPPSSQEPNNNQHSPSPSEGQDPHYLDAHPHDSSTGDRPGIVSEYQSPQYPSSDAPEVTIIVPDRDPSQLPYIMQTTIPSEDLRTEYTVPKYIEQPQSYPSNRPPFPTDRLPAADGEWSSLEPEIVSQPGRFEIPETHIRPQSEFTRPLFTPKDTYDQLGQSNKPKPHHQQGSFPENLVQTDRPDHLFPQETFPLGQISSTESDVERVKEFYVPHSSIKVLKPLYPTMDGHTPIQEPQFTLNIPTDHERTEYPADDGTQIPQIPIIGSDIGTLEITEATLHNNGNPQYDSLGTEVPERFHDRFTTQIYPSALKPELSRPPFLPIQYSTENHQIQDVRPILPKSSSQPDTAQIQKFSIPDELKPPREEYPVYPSTYNDNIEIEEQNQTQSQYSSMISRKPIQPSPKSMPVQATKNLEQEPSLTDEKSLHDSQYPRPISEELDKYPNYLPYSQRVTQYHPDEEEPTTSQHEQQFKPDQILSLNYLHPHPTDDTVPGIDLFEVPQGQRLPGASPVTQYPSKHNEGPSPHQRPSAAVDIDTFTIPQVIPQPHGSAYPKYPFTDKEMPGDRYLHPRYPPEHTPKLQYPEHYPDQSRPRSLAYTEDFPVIEPKSITPYVHLNMDRMDVTEPSIKRYSSGVILPIPPDEQLTIIPNEYYPDGNYPIDKTVGHQPGYSAMFPYRESIRPEVSKHQELGDFQKNLFPTSVEGTDKPTVFFYPERRHSDILPIQPYGSQLERSPIGSQLPSMPDSSSTQEPDESQTYKQMYPRRKSLDLKPFDLLSTPGHPDNFPREISRDQPQPSPESGSYLPRSERYPSLIIHSKDSTVDTSEPILEEPLTTARYRDSPDIYSTNLYPTPRHHHQPSGEYVSVTTSQAPPDKRSEQTNPQDVLDTTILIPTSPIIGLLPRQNIEQPAPQFPLTSYDSSHREIPNEQTVNPTKLLQDGGNRPSESIPRDDSTINSIDFPTSTDGTEKRPVNGSITRPSVEDKDENLTTPDKTTDPGTPLYESADDLSTQPRQVMSAEVQTDNSPFQKLDDGGLSTERTPSVGVTEIDPQLTTSVDFGRFSPTPEPNLLPPGMTTPCSVTPISPDGRDGSALATSQNLRPCITDSPPKIPFDQSTMPDSKITRIFPVSKPTFYTDKDGQKFVNLKLLNEPIPTTNSQDIVLSEAPSSPQRPGMVDLVVPIVGDVIPNQEPNNLPSPSLLQNSTLPHPILKSIPIDKVQVFDAQTIIKVIESCDCTNLKFLIPILKRPKSAIVVANNEYPGIENHDSTKSDTPS